MKEKKNEGKESWEKTEKLCNPLLIKGWDFKGLLSNVIKASQESKII